MIKLFSRYLDHRGWGWGRGMGKGGVEIGLSGPWKLSDSLQS